LSADSPPCLYVLGDRIKLLICNVDEFTAVISDPSQLITKLLDSFDNISCSHFELSCHIFYIHYFSPLNPSDHFLNFSFLLDVLLPLLIYLNKIFPLIVLRFLLLLLKLLLFFLFFLFFSFNTFSFQLFLFPPEILFLFTFVHLFSLKSYFFLLLRLSLLFLHFSHLFFSQFFRYFFLLLLISIS
jgi:hypothetical protein